MNHGNDTPASVPLHKVRVTFGTDEPMVTVKEQYEAAHIVFLNECANAARLQGIKPGPAVQLELILPDGSVDKLVVITAIKM